MQFHFKAKWLVMMMTLGLFCQSAAHAELPPIAQKSIAPMLKKVMPAVVNISVQGKIPVIQTEGQNATEQHDKQPPRFGNRKFSSFGSGVIVDASNGYIITNSHVVKYADSIIATVNSGHKYPAKLIGTDPASDVALLQIETRELKELPLADSDKLVVGDFVAAIGNPFGLDQTVTSGIVSGLQRSGLGIEGYEEFIQTDAPINPGNSGGALVDMDGRLIGINTAIMSPAGGNVGIGFAIPSNMVKSVMTQLAKYGQVQRGLVGVLVQPLTPKLAQALKSPSEQAAVVTQISPNSPAAAADIKPGDVILELNGTKIDNATQIRNMIGLMRVGSDIKLKLSRQGKIIEVITSSTDPKEYAKKSEETNARLFGMNLNNFDQQIAGRGHVKGVALIGVAEDSPAWKAGLRPGDVIIAINQKTTNTIDDVERLMAQNTGAKGDALIHILRGNGAMFVMFD